MQRRRIDPGAALCALAFLLCAALTAVYLTAGYGAYLDADMASELALARHLVSEGTLVSGTWYYSTEVRVFGTQLVFAPLMALFPDDWRLVRTLGCLILMALLSAATYAGARMLGARRRYALLAAGLALPPVSPVYAQTVIIGAYYAPHATLSALAVGLVARRMARGGTRAGTAALAAISLAMGLSSMRSLLAPLAPAALSALLLLAFREGEERMPSRAEARGALCALLALAAGLLGAGIAKYVFPKYFHAAFEYYAGVGYAAWSPEGPFSRAERALEGFLEAAGYVPDTPLAGAQGMLNALTLLSLAALALLLARALKRKREGGARFGALTLLLAFALTLAAFTLLGSLYVDRYWLPVLTLALPVAAACLSAEKSALFRRGAAALLAASVLLGGAAVAARSMRRPQVAEDMRMEAVDAALARGLTKGYATFWNANIVTELSNGRIDVVALERGADAEGRATLAPYRWLEAEDDFLMDRPEEPVFLLVGEWETDGMDALLSRAGAEALGLPGYVEMYVIPTQRALFEAAGWQQTP